MGRDKAALPFGDESLLERVIRIVRPKVDELWLVAREGQALPAPAEIPVAVATWSCGNRSDTIVITVTESV